MLKNLQDDINRQNIYFFYVIIQLRSQKNKIVEEGVIYEKIFNRYSYSCYDY